jgi:hypothetical protein
MTIPLTGVLLLPLGLLLACLPWRYCLIGLMVFAMMSPAAVVNAGNFGLQPGYYLAMLLIARTAIEILSRGQMLDGFVLARMRPLALFLIVTVGVLFVALCFFQGRVETLPGTAGFKPNAAQPFYLGRENFTQLAYLILNLCLLYVLGHQAARRGLGPMLQALDTAFAAGLVFSVAVCLWQFASLYGGLPFPADFFYSNAGYGRADSQSMVGLFRINGPFEEPATLGYVFTGYLLFSWTRYRLRPTTPSALMIAACIFCMLVSTSTTAFLGLFLFACVALSDVAAARISLFTRNVSSGQITILALMLAGLLAGSIVASIHWGEIAYIVQNTILQKSESTSFQQRSFADLMAVQIFVETYGIGIGLGSHKANSLLLTLLSNTGILGVVLFGAFLWPLLRQIPAATGRGMTEFSRRSIAPFQWALIGLTLIHVFSNPNLSALVVWVQMGALLSLHAALRKERMVYSLEGEAGGRECVAEPATG